MWEKPPKPYKIGGRTLMDNEVEVKVFRLLDTPIEEILRWPGVAGAEHYPQNNQTWIAYWNDMRGGY